MPNDSVDYAPIVWPREIPDSLLIELGNAIRQDTTGFGVPAVVAPFILLEAEKKLNDAQSEVEAVKKSLDTALENFRNDRRVSSAIYSAAIAFQSALLRREEVLGYQRVGEEVVWAIDTAKGQNLEYPLPLPGTPRELTSDLIKGNFAIELDIAPRAGKELAAIANEAETTVALTQANLIVRAANLGKLKFRLFEQEPSGISLLQDLETSVKSLLEGNVALAQPALLGVQAGISRYKQLYNALSSAIKI